MKAAQLVAQATTKKAQTAAQKTTKAASGVAGKPNILVIMGDDIG